MKRNEYISMLSKHIYESNQSVYDYYYDLAKRIRLAENSNFESWEVECPFLTGTDYTKLLFSKDPQICEFFASAMEKVYRFNEVTALVPVEENKLMVTEDKEKEVTEENKKDEEFVSVDEELTKNDMSDIVNREMEKIPEEDTDELTKDAMTDIVNEAADNITDEDLTKNDMTDVVNEEMDKIPEDKEELTRKDMADSIDEAMDTLTEAVDAKLISRDEIEEIINEHFDKLEKDVVEISEDDELLSSEDIKEVIDESASKLGKLGVLFHTISNKISSLLNGFAVVREKEDKKVDLYYHDAESDTLTGKKTIENSNLESGYYVNYQEYVDNMLDSLTDKYPTATMIEFINENEEVCSLNQLLDSTFKVLHEAGAIRFGKELEHANISSYGDLKDLELTGNGMYAGNELRKGMYVRRDILNKIFSKYKAKITLEQKEEEEVIGKSK